MGFLADVKSEAPPRGPECSVAIWLSAVPAEVAAEFREAVADRSIASTIILKVMRDKHGYKANANTVQRHRRGECKCHG